MKNNINWGEIKKHFVHVTIWENLAWVSALEKTIQSFHSKKVNMKILQKDEQ